MLELRKGKRFGGNIVKVDGDQREAENKSMSISLAISRSQIIDVSNGDFYYKK